MSKVLKSERPCHGASYCCIPRCAYLSSELNICRCSQVCTLSHPSLPNLCKVPRRQSHRIQCSLCLTKPTSWIAFQANRKGGGDRQLSPHIRIKPRPLVPDQLCRADSTITPLWGLPGEVKQDLQVGLCPLVSLSIISTYQKQMKRLSKILMLSLTPRCCGGE